MIDSHDYHNPFNPINQKEVDMYTEEQLLLEQIDILETRLNERIRQVQYLQSQLKRLAEIERMNSTFGQLTFEEYKEKQIILSIYETI
jgi:hypothetical protein